MLFQPPQDLVQVAILFDKTSILLTLPKSTQLSTLPSLILPPLALADREGSPLVTDESLLRIVRRDTTDENKYYPVDKGGATTVGAVVGRGWESFFLQFRDSQSSDWNPVSVKVPSIDDEEVEYSETLGGAVYLPPLPNLDVADNNDDEVTYVGKGKGRAVALSEEL